MFPTSSTTQVITPFGSGYVPMHHAEPARWNLARADVDDFSAAIRVSMLGDVLKALRAALYLK